MSCLEPDDEQTMLPESLEKLQIMANNQKCTIIGYNPFDLRNVPGSTNINLEEQLFGPKCNHKIEHGKKDKIDQVIHQTKKQYNKASTTTKAYKKIFREPILHYLNDNYYSVYGNKNVAVSKSNAAPSTSSNAYENFPSISDANNSNKNHIDFKTLVNDCANLTLCSSISSSSAIDCKSESFQIMQKPTINRDKCTMGKYKFPSTNIAASNQLLIRPQSSPSLLSLDALTSSSTLTNDIDNNNNNNINANNNNNTSNTSCSQQALLTYSPCDITCDELASYFETFVYIPKKMSTMADAMYI